MKKKVLLAISVVAIVIGFVLAGYLGPRFLAEYGVETEVHIGQSGDDWFYVWVETVGTTLYFL